MKNTINITTEGEQLVSSTDDGTNTLYINDNEIPSSNWIGSGNYTTTVNGHAITIKKCTDLNGNCQLVKLSDYNYEMRKTALAGQLQMLNYIYPVGSYYETSDASFNPNTAWGGTWVKETEQVRTASWTATSTNANNAKVTNSLMLPTGTYIGWIKIPVCSQETALAFTTNLGYETGGMFAKGQSILSFTFTLSAETEIYAQTNMSHVTNYTYTERGYLKVLRISSHIGNRWHRTA